MLVRILAAVLLLSVSGCIEPTGALLGANVASVAVFGRGVGDIFISAASGRDCSIVRLEQGKPYCAPVEAPPGPQMFCSRSLGRVECWANPEAFGDNRPRGVADARGLTPEQDANRTRRWPDLGQLPANRASAGGG